VLFPFVNTFEKFIYATYALRARAPSKINDGRRATHLLPVGFIYDAIIKSIN